MMRATDGTSRTHFFRSAGLREPVAAIVVFSTILAVAIGLFLGVRRAVGAMTAPLPPLELVATACGLLAWIMIAHVFVPQSKTIGRVRHAVIVLFAFACSFPGARAIDWAVWLSVLALDWVLPKKGSKPVHNPARHSSPAIDSVGVKEEVLQLATRVRTADGTALIRGSAMAEFAPGERQTTLYFGFCPPFEFRPSIEVHVSDDIESEVKLVQVLHNGAQIEVRLSEPAEEALAMRIEYVAIEGRSS
jgi:hypothetical protein